ncbi:MAG TPA: hypothetical protein VF030_07865 [Solirubrobacterales bacterium]
MSRLLMFLSLCLAFASSACARTAPPTVAPTSAARSSVVVMGAFFVPETGLAWRPLCGGVAVRERLVITALECTRPEGLLALAVADADLWMTTSGGQIDAVPYTTDPERQLATLLVSSPLSGARVSESAASAHDGDLVSVARGPETEERSVVMSARAEGGLISAATRPGCMDLVRGSGVFLPDGRLAGVVVQGSAIGSEYRVPRFQIGEE